MSVQTQALVQAAPKKGMPAEGQSGRSGSESASDTAAKFQSVLEGARQSGSGASGAPVRDKDSQQEAINTEADSQTDSVTKSPAGEKSEPKTGEFLIANLTKAIKTASQNASAKPENDGASNNGQPVSEENTVPKQLGASEAVAPAALSLKSVLTGLIGMPKSEQAGSALQSYAPKGPDVQAQMMPSAGSLADGAGPKTGTSSLFAQFGVEPETIADGQTGRGLSGQALPADAAESVKVLKQETHFAPNLRLSPAQQVGEQIATAFRDLPDDMGRFASGLSAKAEGPVLKTLDIQLTPHELGTVKVSMRMVGDTVEVQLIASRSQTAELLKTDRLMLDQMLRSTGLTADAITIQAADDRVTNQVSASSANSSAQNQNGNSSESQFGGQRDGQNGERSGKSDNGSADNSRDDAFQTTENTRGQDHEAGSDIRLSDGIYL